MGAPDVAYVRQYQTNITMLAQQMDSRLRQAVMVDTNFTGFKKFYNQYATDSMIELTSRYQDTPTQTPNHARRMVTPRYFVSNTLEDPVDALQMTSDPKSAYMQAKQAAANRQQDDIIIAAMSATAYTGQDGGTSQSLSNTNTPPGGGTGVANLITAQGAGMSKAKVIRAKRYLDTGEVDKADRFMVCSAAQLEDLLGQTEVTSSDFNSVKALVEGTVDSWVGFKWLHSERLAVDGSSNRLCYAWQRKALQLAIQKDVEGRMDERPDKNYAYQVYMRMCMGATRLEESRIAQIACVEQS